MNGGYLMVSKADTNLYEKLNKALTLGKPVLFYEDDTTCYYIDSITKSGTDIILTKNGKTITIESDGDITESGDVSAPTMESIKDLAGNLRFIEGEGIVNDKITNAYCRWSLSGTHLMFVLAGNIADTTEIEHGELLATFNIPQWVLAKISPVWAVSYIEKKIVLASASDWSSQDFGCVLQKGVNSIYIYKDVTITLTADRGFRIQFDLLIDAA